LKLGIWKPLLNVFERKRPAGRTSHRCESDIKIDLREIGWKSVNWLHLVQDMDQCEYGNEPSASIIGGEFLD
jgi:hypothetical protein